GISVGEAVFGGAVIKPVEVIGIEEIHRVPEVEVHEVVEPEFDTGAYGDDEFLDIPVGFIYRFGAAGRGDPGAIAGQASAHGGVQLGDGFAVGPVDGREIEHAGKGGGVFQPGFERLNVAARGAPVAEIAALVALDAPAHIIGAEG